MSKQQKITRTTGARSTVGAPDAELSWKFVGIFEIENDQSAGNDGPGSLLRKASLRAGM